MSREELVGAYLDGRISRRTLIRRLIAGGVSTGAAISYAQVLAPERAEASVSAASDHYPLVDLAIVTPTLARVREVSRLGVAVTSSEELANLFLRIYLKTASGGVPIGSRTISNFLTAAGRREVAVAVDSSALGSRTSARFYVQAWASDAERYPAVASTAKTLS